MDPEGNVKKKKCSLGWRKWYKSETYKSETYESKTYVCIKEGRALERRK